MNHIYYYKFFFSALCLYFKRKRIVCNFESPSCKICVNCNLTILVNFFKR